MTFIFSLFLFSTLILTSCKKDTKVENPLPKNCISKPSGEIFDEIPNLGFEDWTTGRTLEIPPQSYHIPTPTGFWTTPNEGTGSIGSIATVPVVVYRVDGDEARTGYAAKLVTGMGKLGNKDMLAAATIASGEFKIDVANPLNTLNFGRKFTRKPKKMTGYYKYFPVEGDSASAYCFVTKFHEDGCQIDTLGFGRILFYDEQSEYAQFEVDVKEYKNSGYPNVAPDRLVIYFSSSEAGDKFEGQPGNTLYIDDVEVEYYE